MPIAARTFNQKDIEVALSFVEKDQNLTFTAEFRTSIIVELSSKSWSTRDLRCTISQILHEHGMDNLCSKIFDALTNVFSISKPSIIAFPG